MTILNLLIWNLVVPAAISATIISLARRLGRQGNSGRRGRWGVALGLGLGYLAGHVGLLGWPSLPGPNLDAKVWVAWLALDAALVGIVEASWPVRWWASWAARGVLVAGALGFLLRSKVENDWTPRESAVWLGGLWLILLASWWNLEAQSERLSGPGWVVPVGLVASGWAAVQMICHSAALAQLEGVLASTLLGALLTVGLRPGLALSKGGPPVVLIILAGLGLTGFFYSNEEVPPAAALILMAAQWAPWVDRIGFIRRRSYWTRASVRFLAVLLTVGTAVFVVSSGGALDTENESAL
jgi:hypothetical protein